MKESGDGVQTSRVHEIDLALCRSAIYEALAIGFYRPTEEVLRRLSQESGNLSLSLLALALDMHAGTDVTGDKSLSGLIERLGQAACASSLNSLEEAYHRLFGHTALANVPPYETEYGKDTLFQQPHELADIAGFYRAFGLCPGVAERVDHITCECEFMAFLARKEAYAIENNHDSMYEETKKAGRLFLECHLAKFIPSFVCRVVEEKAEGFYTVLAQLCERFVHCECGRQGVQPGSQGLPLRTMPRPEEFGGCGTAGPELLQIRRT